MQMLMLISLAFLQEAEPEKVDLAKTKLFFYDAARGMTLRIHDDGTVDLSVREKDGAATRTYTARTAEAFGKAYPDAVRRYDLGRYLGGGLAHRPQRLLGVSS